MLTGIGGQLALFRRYAGFRRLFVAALGSGIGTFLAAIALTVHVWDLTGSGVWVAGLLVADFLPIVVIGFACGPLVDRLPRRGLMVAADLVRFGVFAALPFVGSAGAIVGLAAVSGVATGFFRPAVYAGLPNLVDDDDLEEANALFAVAENLAWMIGPLLASGLLLAGPNLPYVVNAATFLFSALLLVRIPASSLQSERSLSRGHWRDVADGLRLVVSTPQLRTVLVVWNVAMMANAGINVGEIAFAKDDLGGGDFGFALIVAATGLGLAVGSFVTPFVLSAVGLKRVYAGSIAVMGLGYGLATLATTIWVAAPLAAFATLGNGAAIVCNQLLIQRGAPDAMRGRAIAVLMSSTYATLAVAMAGAGLVVNALGGRAAWLLAACVYGLGALVAVVMMRRVAIPAARSAPAGLVEAEEAA